MIRTLRTALLVGVSSVGICGTGSAALAAGGGADPTTVNVPATATTNGDSGQLEEVIVTAQRRAENIQRVPIAVEQVSAKSATDQGVAGTNDLSTAIPGLSFTQGANASVPFLRGVGTTTNAVGNEASVAMYVDDVYISNVNASLFEFNNIESIEVLKGPQGTLFGRNATGGVIQIHTRDPGRVATADMSAGYANYDTFSGAFYGSAPIGEHFAVNVAAYGRKQNDGWGKDLVTGAPTFTSEDYGVRAKLLWTPTDKTRVLLSGDYNHTRNENGLGFHVIPGSYGIGGTTSAGFYNTYDDPNDYNRVNQAGGSLKIEQDFGAVKAVSITSYRNVDGFFLLDQDATPLEIVRAPISQQAQTFTQELQLLSNTPSKLQWIVGGYYFHDISEYDPLQIEGAAAGGLDFIDISARQKTSSFAGFGQATYAITDRNHITLGARYTKDDRSIDGSTIASVGGAIIPLGAGSQSKGWGKATWRIALDHQFNDDTMAYVSFNRGFKSGVYNLLTYTKPPVNPEVLDAYEIGLKTELFDRRLRLNGAAFYYDYSNIQLTKIVSGSTVTINAASATIKGFDFSFTARPTEHLTVKGGAAVLDGHYGTFLNAPFFQPNGLPGGGNSTVPCTGAPPGNTRAPCDASGFDTVRTPKFSGNISGDYTVPLMRGELDFVLSYYYNSGFNWDPDPRIQQSAYSLVNGSIGWMAPGGAYDIRVWAKNLSGTKYCIYATATTLIDSCAPAAPRTFGVTVGVHF